MALLWKAPCRTPAVLGRPLVRGRDRANSLETMTHETDIPCSDCGTELVERTVDVRELATATAADGRVNVAVCPSCGARYYPDETLTHLTGTNPDSRPRGDS